MELEIDNFENHLFTHVSLSYVPEYFENWSRKNIRREYCRGKTPKRLGKKEPKAGYHLLFLNTPNLEHFKGNFQPSTLLIMTFTFILGRYPSTIHKFKRGWIEQTPHQVARQRHCDWLPLFHVLYFSIKQIKAFTALIQYNLCVPNRFRDIGVRKLIIPKTTCSPHVFCTTFPNKILKGKLRRKYCRGLKIPERTKGWILS